MKLNEQILNGRKHRHSKIRSTTKPSSKQFWSLARRVLKKASSLSAIKDLQGNLATERDEIINIVLAELSLIFIGKRSPIFSSRNGQIIKEVVMKQSDSWKPWIPIVTDRLAHKAEVCKEVKECEVTDIINSLKQERAPRVDGITSPMLRHTGPNFIRLLTDLINCILSDGVVPDSLLTGKITLIDKKAPSLLVANKRPLRVSSSLLFVYTKLIHSQMDPICEKKGYYGDIQYRFWSNRSNSDCVFMLLEAIRRTKKEKGLFYIYSLL